MTSTCGSSAGITWFGGIDLPKAAETSPAQIGLIPAALSTPITAATVPSLVLRLRNVSESLPSSLATVSSACSSVTSNVTVRPKPFPPGAALASSGSIASTRRFSTTVSPTERRAGRGSFLNVCVSIRSTRSPGDRMTVLAPPVVTGIAIARVRRREHDLQKIAIPGPDDGAASDRLERVQGIAQRCAGYCRKPLLVDRRARIGTRNRPHELIRLRSTGDRPPTDVFRSQQCPCRQG